MRNIVLLFGFFLVIVGCASKKVVENTKEQTYQTDSVQSSQENQLFVDTSYWNSGVITHAHIEFDVDTTAAGILPNDTGMTGTAQVVNVMGINFPLPNRARLKSIDLTTIEKSQGQKGVTSKAEKQSFVRNTTQVTNKAKNTKTTKTPVSAVRYWWVWYGLFVILLVWFWFRRNRISNWMQYVWGWIRAPTSL